MQRADYLLGDAQYAADVARDDFERADRRAAELARDIDRLQRDVDDASRRLDEADRSSKWLREEIDRCNEAAWTPGGRNWTRPASGSGRHAQAPGQTG